MATIKIGPQLKAVEYVQKSKEAAVREMESLGPRSNCERDDLSQSCPSQHTYLGRKPCVATTDLQIEL